MIFFKKKLLLAVLPLIFIFIFSLQANASVFDTIKGTFTATGQKAGYQADTNETSLVSSWQGYVNGLLVLMGAFFLLQMIYAGWLWMSARGNDQQIEKSKHILINASIALGIIIGTRIIAEIIFNVLGNTLKIAPPTTK